MKRVLSNLTARVRKEVGCFFFGIGAAAAAPTSAFTAGSTVVLKTSRPGGRPGLSACPVARDVAIRKSERRSLRCVGIDDRFRSTVRTLTDRSYS